MREADGDAVGLGSQVLTQLWGRDRAAGGAERWEGGGGWLEKDSFAICKDSTSCQTLLFHFTRRPQKAHEGAGDQGLYKSRWAVKSRGCQTNSDVNPSGAVKNRACKIPLAPWHLRPRVNDYQFAASKSVKRTIPL